MSTEQNTKTVVSVSEMARMVGLSRQRFYQLAGSTFPSPIYDIESRRPFFTEEMQRICLEVRRRNCGVDGKPVMFYSKGHQLSKQQKPKRKKVKPTTPKHTAIVDAVQALGLSSVNDKQVDDVISVLFPGGTNDIPEAEVIRAVFVHLQRQNSTDKLGR